MAASSVRTMRAVICKGRGGVDQLVVEQVPRPVRKAGEVLVKVHATSVNPIEYKLRRGDIPMAPPKILGADLAGVVEEADEASKFKVGDKVFAHANGGTYCEYSCVRESLLVPIPPGLSFEQAAAVPLVGLTAWQAITAGRLQEGQRLLVQAGSGGVGHMAVQIGKAQGLHVTATCSTRNIDFLKGLGVDEVVDYTSQDIVQMFKDRPFDGVVDLVGGDTEVKSRAVTKRNGYFAEVLNSGWQKKYGNGAMAWAAMLAATVQYKLASALRMGPVYKVVIMQTKGEDLRQLAALIERGLVKPVIDRAFALEDIRQAHEYMEQGHARGKVVIRVAA